MTDPTMIMDDDGNLVPEPANMRRERELFEAYRRKFGEAPPMFTLGPDALVRIQEAVKTGTPIRTDIPDGADA